MLGARPKKMMNMYIYDILRRNTDAEHPMTQREIQKRLESDYDMAVDRKAVKANLEDLINDGSYNIEYATKIRLTPNRLTGEIEKNEVLTGFYYDNIFTDSELRLLMDSVLFSRSIPTNNKKEMLGKLKDLSNKYFKFSTANIQSYESVDREMNRELFYTIEVLDEAISKGLQVKFLYNEYGTDKKLHHRKNEDDDVREYIINPYTMVANGGKYYLICNYDKYDNLSHYRIDRISNIEILETPRKPKNQVEGLVGLDVAKYMQEHIFMFGGKSIRAKFEMPSYLISDEGEFEVVRVRDYGPGIPEAELPFIKQKFYKGSSKARGSGIGLAVCDEIVGLHNGIFTIGNADGGGAVVTICLPVKE